MTDTYSDLDSSSVSITECESESEHEISLPTVFELRINRKTLRGRHAGQPTLTVATTNQRGT